MKKLFWVVVYLPLIFSSCKEEEEVILSNDIIVGDWIIYHKEVTGSDSTLSFAENSYDLETISLSVKSDYTWTAPLNANQPSNPWEGLNAGGSWELSYNYYYFDDSDISSGWTHSFYCSNNFMKLSTGGDPSSPADKLIYYFQRDGYDFSDCDEISYYENP